MKKVIYTRPDGGVSVFNPIEGARLARSITMPDGTVLKHPEDRIDSVDKIFRRWPVEGAVADWAETEDEFVARVSPRSIPVDASDIQTVDESVIPKDRTFRGAWKAGRGTIEHDMEKCREIHKCRLREIRAPKLAALDAEYMKALEAGDTRRQASIAAQKQALRDVTKAPELVNARTPDELKSVIPEVLS